MSDAPLIQPAQIRAIAERWPDKAVYVAATRNPRYIPDGSIWVGAEGESAGIVLLPDGAEDVS